MICYVCKFNTESWKSLVYHFKIFHLLKFDSNYTCCEETCTQSFHNLATFKRHLHKKHIAPLLEPELEPSCYNNSPLLPQSTETVDSQNFLTETPVNEIPFNLDLFSETIYTSAIEFIVSLHNNNNFTRVDIISIQTGILDSIIAPIVSMLKAIIDDEIKEPISRGKFHRVTSVIENTFQYCNSEYRLIDWLKKNEYLCNIYQFTINKEICPVQHIGESVYDEKNTTGALLPLKFQFKKYFEQGDNFKKQFTKLNFYKNNESTSMENFVQGNLWKKKVLLQNKICIPFFLYTDEFEINNPLGSHANFHSVSAFYYSFPLEDNCSKLSYIYLAALIKHVDLKLFGNDQCLHGLVNEINMLEKEGIDIVTQEGIFHVHFILGIILGDNLGLNSVMEFSKSFSANFFCRFCKANKADTRVMHEEDINCMRNVQNYSEDVVTMNFIETGIYKDSFLNQITSFHVTKNYCIDIMHDLFEGICHYDLCHIIRYYIDTAKLFSLETLNSRKMNFNYGQIEIGNISPPITALHLKKNHLKMSAREVMTFMHFFSLIIGDLIPESDEVWELFLLLLKITDILLSYTFTENAISYLKQLISQHNLLYLTLFNDNLKPKHHFLVHYPTIIQNSGPPRHYWCFRFEGKHRELKMYARSTTSRKNITLTLAKKYQFKFAYNLMKDLDKKIIFKDKHKVLTKYNEIINNRLNITSLQYTCYTELRFNGILYKDGYYLTKHCDEMCLFKIFELISMNNNPDNIVYILTKKILLNGFNSHFESFIVNNSEEEANGCFIFKINEFSGPPINVTTVSSGQKMIRLKEFY